jgi:hypothetical protein
MYCLKVLALFLVLGGSLTLTACLGNGATSTRQIQTCFSQLPTSQVHPVGSAISFTVRTVHGVFTYSVPKSAFGGSPAAMKNGDIITFCAELVDTGGAQSTTTITQFSDQGQPVATGTPQSP